MTAKKCKCETVARLYFFHSSVAQSKQKRVAILVLVGSDTGLVTKLAAKDCSDSGWWSVGRLALPAQDLYCVADQLKRTDEAVHFRLGATGRSQRGLTTSQCVFRSVLSTEAYATSMFFTVMMHV